MNLLKQSWKVIEKGNTVKSLAIETSKGDKICSGISLKNKELAKIICKLPDMYEILYDIHNYTNLDNNSAIESLLFMLDHLFEELGGE